LTSGRNFFHSPGATKSLLGSAEEGLNPVGSFAGFRKLQLQNKSTGKEKESIVMKTKIRNSISALLLIPLVLACFALLPSVRATPDPGAVGGVSNTADGNGALDSVGGGGTGNTAFGTNALTDLTTGDNNNAQGNAALQDLTTGGGNAGIGSLAAQHLTTGIHNVAVGNTALNAVTTGSRNTAVGYGTLRSGNFSDNVAVGWSALISNTTGSPNVAVGTQALRLNTSGARNSAVGYGALRSNTIATDNTAIGWLALASNTTGGGTLGLNNGNTAVGSQALFSNTVGRSNTAVGFRALFNNIGDPVFSIGGNFNTAIGNLALASNTLGTRNTALGSNALSSNTEGLDNTAIGLNALASSTGSRNTAIGSGALQQALGGEQNIALGELAGSNVVGASGNIHIGSEGTSTDSHVIRIGSLLAGGQTSTFIAGIYNRSFGPADMAVRIGNNGKLGTVVSSRRFKHDIKPIDDASEAILALKPVTFHYKSDTTNAPRFGLIAEEVAEVSPELVIPDKEGKPLSVRYEDVNVMLLNEFLKEHHQVQDLKTIVAEQQKQIEALTAGLQKVSAQLEVSRPTPQVAENLQ
jgi:hypothetical protein